MIMKNKYIFLLFLSVFGVFVFSPLEAVAKKKKKGKIEQVKPKSAYEKLLKAKLKTYGAGRDLSYKEWKEYIYQMIQLGYMEIDYAAERVLRMTPLGRRVLYGEQKAQLVIYREPDELTRPVRRGERKSSFKAQPIRPIRSASTDETLLDSLRQLRKQIAEREHTPAYIIFSDDSLEDMVEKKPVTLDQFSDIRGVGQIKLDRYGKVFVALIRFVLKLPK